jgi:hypothetical protein
MKDLRMNPISAQDVEGLKSKIIKVDNPIEGWTFIQKGKYFAIKDKFVNYEFKHKHNAESSWITVGYLDLKLLIKKINSFINVR